MSRITQSYPNAAKPIPNCVSRTLILDCALAAVTPGHEQLALAQREVVLIWPNTATAFVLNANWSGLGAASARFVNC